MVGRAAWHLRPVHERLLGKLKSSPKLLPTRRPRRCSIRAAARRRQANSGPMPAMTDYGTGRPAGRRLYLCAGPKGRLPIAHLAGFTGILQVDGYGGYRVLAERSDVTLAFCWAHVRRRFYELAAVGLAPIASEALGRIAELYKIEDGIRGRSAEERRAMRQENSRAIIADLEPWLRGKARLDQPENQARRGDPLHALALERPLALP
ncbi:hypothetical protein MES5069_450024 [Mesorhizobium escarrei]|uniref:Transposase IS66 central domain-containing protein n=1 Tax=Mesorhizobium escarrei TaxID=666018 RepID=A0ABM9E7E2_9HYPH|nr:hypothetical protein MES5069_450024 [Mesorhizobium escarrei]